MEFSLRKIILYDNLLLFEAIDSRKNRNMKWWKRYKKANSMRVGVGGRYPNLPLMFAMFCFAISKLALNKKRKEEKLRKATNTHSKARKTGACPSILTSHTLCRMYDAKGGIPGGPPANSISMVNNLKKGLAACKTHMSLLRHASISLI